MSGTLPPKEGKEEEFIHGECEACGYTTRLFEFPSKGWNPKQHTPEAATKRICRLCSNTATGMLADCYSSTHSCKEHAPVLRTMCYLANLLLDEMTGGDAPENPET